MSGAGQEAQGQRVRMVRLLLFRISQESERDISDVVPNNDQTPKFFRCLLHLQTSVRLESTYLRFNITTS